MSGLKRKPTESAPNSAKKPAKKQKLPPTPKRPALSEDFVVDSSDEEENTKANGSESKLLKSSESKERPKKARLLSATTKAGKPRAHLTKRPQSNSPVVISSTSGSSRSEKSESGEQSSAHSGSESSQPIGSAEDTSDEEKESTAEDGRPDQTGSESESERESKSEVKEAPHGRVGSATDEGTDGATGNESPDNSDQSESDEDEAPLDPVPLTSSSAPHEPPPPYHPPAGFELATVTSSRKIQDLFSRENLKGKQIWHITSPASVPISSIKEVLHEKIGSGDPILSYKDANYGLVEADADSIGKVLLIPSSNENSYKPASAKIAWALHLQQIVKLPSSERRTDTVNGVLKTAKTHVKTIRQQPEELRMRYRPFGDESSSEDSDTSPQFKRPPTLPYTSSAKKPRADQNGRSTSPVEMTTSGKSQNPVEEIDSPVQRHKESAAETGQRSAEKKRRKERRSSQTRTPNEADGVRETLVSGEKHLTPNGTEPRKAPAKERKKAKKKKEAHGLTNGATYLSNKGHETKTDTLKSVKDTPQDQAEPEKVKTKRKKRKFEATEEV
ncbi:MAG: hypothetical protein LQ346_001111 [Caloplaca aetnensis]|nr:MAG: hypothetical protein LQ346_001111 [Caloplaca aetnensis]